MTMTAEQIALRAKREQHDREEAERYEAIAKTEAELEAEADEYFRDLDEAIRQNRI